MWKYTLLTFLGCVKENRSVTIHCTTKWLYYTGSRGSTPPVQQRKSPTLDQGTQHPSSSPEKSQRPQQNHPHQNHPSQGPPRGDHRWDRRPPPQHHQQQQRPQSTSSYSRGRGSDRGGFPRGGRGGMQDRRDSKSSWNLKVRCQLVFSKSWIILLASHGWVFNMSWINFQHLINIIQLTTCGSIMVITLFIQIQMYVNTIMVITLFIQIQCM